MNMILKSFKPIQMIIEKMKKKNVKRKKSSKNSKKVKKYELDNSSSSSSSFDYNLSDAEDDFFEISIDQDNSLPILNMNSALQNCGNTCYINPALQILFQILFIEAFFENPKEECSELGQCLKTLYYEVKFSEIVCNPIDFICTYKNFYDHDDQVGGDASECLAHLFEILDSSFIFDNSLFLCQIKKSVTCDKNHSYIYDYFL